MSEVTVEEYMEALNGGGGAQYSNTNFVERRS